VVACPFVRGAAAFLERFSERLPLYVVSASPTAEIRRVIEARDLRRHFRGTFGSPTAKLDHARRILSREGASPLAAIYVGDSVEDYRVARALGMPFIGRRNKEKLEEVEGPVYADLVGVSADVSARLASATPAPIAFADSDSTP
jgi:phosphoglycolate phosphatase-like HAD superfamily hydrolase